MLYWFLNFTPQTRPACQVVLQTPSKSLGSHEVTFSPTVCSRKSFSCNTYGSPRKCCKQKTYGKTNSFRCNTYKKQGEGGRSRFGPLSLLSLPLYFHTCLLHLFSSPGVTPHDPATHIQPPAHAQSLDRQRTHGKDP